MTVADANAIADAVVGGKADLGIETLPVLNDIARGDRNTALNVKNLPDAPLAEMAFAVAKDNSELLDIVNKSLGNITAAEHERLRQRWFASFTQKEMDWGVFLRTALPFVLAHLQSRVRRSFQL